MQKNLKIPAVAAAVVIIGIVAFLAGLSWGKGKSDFGDRNGQFNRQASGQRPGGMMQGSGQGRGAGMTAGEILSQDDKSITLKLHDGGSKIIFYSTATKVSKMADATTSDLIVGQNISVTGKTNTDGSVVAEAIQIRPAFAPAPKP